MKVIYTKDESGWWQARVPSILGCHTQGRTKKEAEQRIKEVIKLFTEEIPNYLQLEK